MTCFSLGPVLLGLGQKVVPGQRIVLFHRFALANKQNSSGNFLTTVDCYDTATGVWTVITGLSSGRTELGAAAANGLVLFAGGRQTSQSSVTAYIDFLDTSTNLWSNLAVFTILMYAPTSLTMLLESLPGKIVSCRRIRWQLHHFRRGH